MKQTLCRGLWLGILLLYCAASIIFPIIQAEGFRAVFAPYLVRSPTAEVGPAMHVTTISLQAGVSRPETVLHEIRLATSHEHCRVMAGTHSRSTLSLPTFTHAVSVKKIALMVAYGFVRSLQGKAHSSMLTQVSLKRLPSSADLKHSSMPTGTVGVSISPVRAHSKTQNVHLN